MGRCNFKTCETVVVEPSDQPRVECIGNAKSEETSKNLIKMCSSFRRKMIRQYGCRLRRCLAARHLAVEYPQRICVHTTPTVLTQQRCMLCEESKQDRFVRCAVAGGSKAIDLECEVGQSQIR